MGRDIERAESHTGDEAMRAVCGEARVEQAVTIRKNAAQASASAWGWGSPRVFPDDVTPELRFSGLRNPGFGANGLQRPMPGQ